MSDPERDKVDKIFNFEDEEDNNPFPELHDFSYSGPDGSKYHQNQEAQIDRDISEDESLLLYDSRNTNDLKNSTNSSKEGFKSVQINAESRIARLLRQDKNLKMKIINAGSSNEGMSNSSKTYIVYTILLKDSDDPKEEIQTRRRYSDFESLRDVLVKIFPLLIIPPIPLKNYFNFSLLNGIVGGNLQQVSSSKASQQNLVSTDSNQEANYAYINSPHLNKNKLIEHRKRLLSNFLNNCLGIPKIRDLEFFAKFLDPNANWSDEIKLISSQLPKSIYLSNPQNGLKTDTIYSHLPIPANSHSINISFLRPLQENRRKSSRKSSKVKSGGTENSISVEDMATGVSSSGVPKNSNDYIIDTSYLDEINKKIMSNFISLSKEYTEFGTAFNSFSLIMTESPMVRTKGKGAEENEDIKLSMIIDKIGQTFDRSYVTLNTLVSELETKFSEPLGEAVQYSEVLEFVNKFKHKKIKQKALVDSYLKEKQKEVEDVTKAESNSAGIEAASNNNSKARDSNLSSNVETPISQDSSQNPIDGPKSMKYRYLPGIGSFKKITQYINEIIDQNPEETKRQKIASLKQKIEIFSKCQEVMLKDVSYVTDEVDKTFKEFHIKQLKTIYEMLLSYFGFLVTWAKKNLEIWEEIRDEVSKNL